MSKILVTGSAGFIGFHLINRLVKGDHDITGIDNINDYYDVNLKYARLKESGIEGVIATNQNVGSMIHNNYIFKRQDICNKEKLIELFREKKFDYVIHLAAQAGVRYSLINPQAYIDSNITGFFNLLEACKKYPPKHLIFASSSSVYGNNDKVPFSEDDNTDHPISLYAATKKSNEVMAHAYSSLYQIPITGLRFFTVYGPWGRPDMAYFSFSKNIIENKPIKLFHNGDLSRDFTYINDIIEILMRLIITDLKIGYETKVNYRLFNAGNSNPVQLMYFVSLLEEYLGRKAIIEFQEMQKGDVNITFADNSDLVNFVKYNFTTDIKEGLKTFVIWFQKYFKTQIK